MTISIIMLPAIISGVSFGVILNQTMPNIIIVVVYVLSLLYFAQGLARKTLVIYK